MKADHASPAMREWIASRMEHFAKIIRTNEIDHLQLQDTRHVVEVPSDKPYIVRADGGVDLFSVTLRFPPGVDLAPNTELPEGAHPVLMPPMPGESH